MRRIIIHHRAAGPGSWLQFFTVATSGHAPCADLRNSAERSNGLHHRHRGALSRLELPLSPLQQASCCARRSEEPGLHALQSLPATAVRTTYTISASNVAHMLRHTVGDLSTLFVRHAKNGGCRHHQHLSMSSLRDDVDTTLVCIRSFRLTAFRGWKACLG
jgi:hypothetical protein